mmetsp:Transcript_17882/g.41380  ORF Transcript_17882/g.41380 Transcript_17882/m.41380 type:complete len:220 (-) Transcript_17882:352-1011(-)|eukprot:CAMPEP_0116843156 /NCGR_PEP_ID=MMETSP0418-20121206/11928_1 /TAXON_ID=1158023 /ORGANISM="Astrosyne radiata, Strain 13vi08-1A" /LENGTH=219 /DNA_ID=CAMNT_0004473871 /DNA_START=22 /DNA_END=681 /DNA_ORIENTATION=+
MTGSIHWSCICRDSTILVEAGEDKGGGSVTRLAQELIRKPPTPGWEFAGRRRMKGVKLHVYDQSLDVVWHFCCVYDTKQDQAQSFLEKLVGLTEFYRDDDDAWRYGDTLAAQATFAPILLQRMQEVSYMGRMAMVHENVDGVKEVMADNIEAMLERGEKLEEMEERANRLQAMSHQFRKRTKAIKRFQQWQNAKYGMLVGTAVTAGVAVIVVPPLVALL